MASSLYAPYIEMGKLRSKTLHIHIATRNDYYHARGHNHTQNRCDRRTKECKKMIGARMIR